MIKFDRFTLDNGLTVLVQKDTNTPIVAVNILYKVGSKDEEPDKTGFAHLFEHLMFGGSVNIPKYDTPLEIAGGENNAFTNNDFTNYYLTIPKNNLEIAFWLESDRMLSLSFNPASLEVQRQVVIEEFKQNYLNQPYGDVYLLLKPLAYKKHPYRWNTIGKDISHIEKATMDDVKAFYKKFYNPDNAILSVSGNVTTEEIESLALKWFGPIEKGNRVKRNYPQEPPQKERREKTVYRNVPQNAIYLAWHMPARKSPEYYTVDLISDLLSNGNSSRLYQSLVKEKKLFSEINAFITGDIDGGLFIITGKLLDNIDINNAENEIYGELDKLSESTIQDKEFQKVQNKVEANLLFSEISVLQKAMNLCYYQMLGDANMFNKEIDNYKAVTAEKIQQTSKNLFNRQRANVLYYLKKQNQN
jgi:predicted Zn-dependent peptidase